MARPVDLEQIEGALLERVGCGHTVERRSAGDPGLDAVLGHAPEIAQQRREAVHRQAVGGALTAEASA